MDKNSSEHNKIEFLLLLPLVSSNAMEEFYFILIKKDLN